MSVQQAVEDYRPGDLVEPDLEECRRHHIGFRKFDWPWTVRRIQGSIVTVERRGCTEQWHRRFLKKVMP